MVGGHSPNGQCSTVWWRDKLSDNSERQMREIFILTLAWGGLHIRRGKNNGGGEGGKVPLLPLYMGSGNDLL
jgi:hypothetical protein